MTLPIEINQKIKYLIQRISKKKDIVKKKIKILYNTRKKI